LKYIEMDIIVYGRGVRLLNITKEGLENSQWARNHQLS